MDREAWHAVIHGIAKSRIWLSDWTELNWIHLLILIGFSGIFRIFYIKYHVICKLWHFYLFFLSSMHSLFFCLIAMARTCNAMLNKMARIGILVLFLILKDMFSLFHCWIWCWLFFVIYGLYYVEIHSFYTHFVESSYH